MWDKIRKWLYDLGEFLFLFTRTTAAQFIKEYGPIALKCVQQAALSGGSGRDRFEKACALLLMEAPGAATYLVQTAIQVAYALHKDTLEKIDTDGDGVPDYRDLCPESGLEVTGCVDKDGCPIDCPEPG